MGDPTGPFYQWVQPTLHPTHGCQSQGQARALIGRTPCHSWIGTRHAGPAHGPAPRLPTWGLGPCQVVGQTRQMREEPRLLIVAFLTYGLAIVAVYSSSPLPLPSRPLLPPLLHRLVQQPLRPYKVSSVSSSSIPKLVPLSSEKENPSKLLPLPWKWLLGAANSSSMSKNVLEWAGPSSKTLLLI